MKWKMDPHNDFDKHDRAPYDIAPATNTPYRDMVRQRDELLAIVRRVADLSPLISDFDKEYKLIKDARATLAALHED